MPSIIERLISIGFPEYFLKSALKKIGTQVYCMCGSSILMHTRIKYKENLRLENLIICSCGNNTWFVTSTAIRCTSCYNLKGDIDINPEIKQSTIIEAMGIPSNIPNALELAEAHLESLKKKEQTLKRIEEIIDAE